MKADKVIIGNIYTVDRNEPKAQAVAIAGGELVILHEIYNERWVRVTDNFEQGSVTWHFNSK